MIQYDIESRPGYLFSELHGAFDLGSAKDTIRAVTREAARQRQPKVLIDATGLKGSLTITDRMAFGTYMAELQVEVMRELPTGPQIAILAAPPIMDPGRFTQVVANNRGARMRASESLQELLSWLGV